MKRMLTLLLTAAMILSLFGCGANLTPQTTEPATEPTSAQTTEPTSAQTGVEADRLINRSVYMEDGFYNGYSEYLYDYDAQRHMLTISDPERKLEEHTFYEGTAQVQSISYYWEPGDAYQYEEYDRQGNLVLYAEYEDGEEILRTDSQYREDGLLIQELTYTGGIETSEEGYWDYDDAGNQTEFIEYYLGEKINHTTWEYDSMGNLLRHDVEGVYGDEPYSEHETFTYDASGVLTESTHRGDDPASCWDYRVEYTYDEAGRKIKAVSYDEERGNCEDTWQYDDHGRLVRSVESAYMDGWIEAVTEYTYNEAGQVISETLAENYEYADEAMFTAETTYRYDEAGRLLQEDCVSNGEYIQGCRYEYDANGNKTLTERTDAEGTVRTEYGYAEGKLTRVVQNGEEMLSGQVLRLTLENDITLLVQTDYAAETPEMEEIEEINAYILGLIKENH